MRQLQRLRQDAELNRRQLAALAELHPARVGGIEAGRITPPNTSVELRRLAAALAFEDDPAMLLAEVTGDVA